MKKFKIGDTFPSFGKHHKYRNYERRLTPIVLGLKDLTVFNFLQNGNAIAFFKLERGDRVFRQSQKNETILLSFVKKYCNRLLYSGLIKKEN
jgi:hypothetical protein